MDLQRFTRYSEKKKGTNNKYYEVEAEELEEGGRARWTFRWARIGYECSKPKTGTSYSFEAAKLVCIQQFAAKEMRGYSEVNAMEALASAVQEVHEREVRGLQPVELEAPCFHAGSSEKRCKAFCKKWLDKLNVVRKSKWDLGDIEYENQIESVLNRYCAEYTRILKTKAHGHLASNSNADTAFRIFFGMLKRDAGIVVYGYFEGIGTS